MVQMYAFPDSLIIAVLLLESVDAQNRMIHIFFGLQQEAKKKVYSSVTVKNIWVLSLIEM